jgi:CMP/dCMP kinase
MIVTIDGYAGSGKSTAARLLAERLGFELLNTGAMYRAVAYVLTRIAVPLDEASRNRNHFEIASILESFTFDMSDSRVRLNGEDLTDHLGSEEIGRGASLVGTIPEVRLKLKREQRRIADQLNIICEGRDQGTSVFPDAPAKFFFTASAMIRAHRRAQQLGIHSEDEPERFAELVKRIEDRDRQDEHRTIDPLQRAEDAILIDTSDKHIDDILTFMTEVVERCRPRV